MSIIKTSIHLAAPSDALNLSQLSEKTFRDAFAQFNQKEDFENYVTRSFTENQILLEILDKASTFFIAKLKDQWIGYAKLCFSHPPECVKSLPSIELCRLYTMQEYLGLGIGPALMNACTKFARNKGCKSIWLGSWKKNHRGNAFYEKIQFEIIGTKTFALGSDIQDDYIFAKSIE